MVRRRAVKAIILLLICTVIHFYSIDAQRIEIGYSNHFSPWISKLLRQVVGWIPFSIGDLLYAFIACWLLWKLTRFFYVLLSKKREHSLKYFLASSFVTFIIFLSAVYIVFNILWGLNYDRKGIAWQIGLEVKQYNKHDLEVINCILIDKLNQSKQTLVASNEPYLSNKELFKSVRKAYEKISNTYPFLEYSPPSLKPSMWGWLGNYTGFTGYYNPFTGEAQVNTTVPKFLQPFIACHETGHQLGYAKEMEANFVAFLASKNSRDTVFLYSVYLDLFTYANRNLFMQDSSSAKVFRKDLDTMVRADYKEWIAFIKSHENPVEPIIRYIYGKYLEGNSQPQGILSYDEVTGFIISYYKKFGDI